MACPGARRRTATAPLRAAENTRLFRHGRRILWGALAALGLFCALTPLPARAELTVFAAASLQGPLDEIAAAHRRATGAEPRLSYASSARLARQIAEGAPADLYVSADLEWMAYLVRRGEIAPEDIRLIARNRLALAAPARRRGAFPADGTDLDDVDILAALGDGRLAVAQTDAPPAGRYARAALESRGEWAAASSRLAEADDVRAALALVARGEAALGIVYASDLVASGDAVWRVGLFPETAHPPILYAAAVTRGAQDRPAALAMLERLASDTAAFERAGFEPAWGRLDDAADPSAANPSAARPAAAASGAGPQSRDAPQPWLGAAEWAAARLSLQVSAAATLATLPVATFLAFVLARRRFWGRGALDAATHLPLLLPPVVTGYLLLVAFGRNGPIGAALEQWFGIVFAFRWTGAALAAGVMALPLMVRAIRLAIEAVDPKLEAAAATLGAGPLSVFWRVTLPMILPGVLAGAALGFAKAMGEFGATITFVASIPGETRTLPSAIYAFVQAPGGDAAAARLVLVSICLSIGALLVSEWLARRALKRARGG